MRMQFPIPDDFIYPIEIAEPVIQDHPPGVLDVGATLRAGKAQYRAQGAAAVQRKKRIIFNNYAFDPPLSLENRRLYELRQQFILHQLRNAGFEVCVIQDDALQPLTHADISALFKNKNLQPANAEKIQAVLQREKLSSDHVAIVDQTKATELLDSFYNEEQWISLSDLQGREIPNSPHIKKMLGSYDRSVQLTPEIDRTVFQAVCINPNDIENANLHYLPCGVDVLKLTGVSSKEHLEILLARVRDTIELENYFDSIAAIARHKPLLKHLVLSQLMTEHFSEISHFHNLESLTLNRIHLVQKKTNLYFPLLTKLIVNSCIDADIVFSCPILKELEITDYVCNIDQLKKLLRQFPTLKKLTIHLPHFEIDDELKKLLDRVQDKNIVWEAEAGDQEEAARQHEAPESLDANTINDPFSSLKFDRIFKSKGLFSRISDISKIMHYRLDLFDGVAVNPNECTADNAFTLHPVSLPTDLEDKSNLISHAALDDTFSKLEDGEKNHYHGHKKVIIKPGEYYALPSFSSYEKMLGIYLKGASTLSLEYSPFQKRYFLKNNGQNTFSDELDFIIAVPKNIPKITIPADVQAHIDYCRGFSGSWTGEALKVKSHATGADYRQALHRQRVGVCRHRAFEFVLLMQEYCPHIPVRYVSSQCHAYAEIYLENNWVLIDLGGGIAIPKISLNSTETDVSVEKTEAVPRVFSEGVYEETVVDSDVFFPETPPIEMQALPDFLATRCNSGDKKHLIKLSGKDAIVGLAYQLQKHCIEQSQPVFYVHDPKELNCKNSYVKQTKNNEGIITEGPGGALYDFLQKYKDNVPPPIVVVNFDRFKSGDFVKFNTLLDKDPKIGGVSVPESTMIIGLIDPSKPDACVDSSFYSRFAEHESTVDFTADALAIPTPFSKEASKEKTRAYWPFATAQDITVDCHATTDWKDYLLGYWYLNGDTLKFKEGVLTEALKKSPHSQTIKFVNPPADPEFQRFLSEAKLKKSITHEGFTFALNPSIQFNYEIREFKKYSPRVVEQVDQTPPADAFVLNPALFSQFLFQDVIVDGKLFRKPGLLENYKNKTVSVYLSHPIDAVLWAQFIDLCERNKVTVDLYRAKSIDPTLVNTAADESLICVDSDDRDVSVYKCTSLYPDAIVIDISEMSANDLLEYTDGKLKHCQFSFSKKQGVLKKALSEGKTVILHGQFSEALQQSLVPTLLAQKKPNATGQLFLVSENQKPFQAIYNTHTHRVTVAEKKEMVGDVLDWNDAKYKRYSATKLLAMKRQIDRKKPNENTPVTDAEKHKKAVQTAHLSMSAFRGMVHVPVAPAASEQNYFSLRNSADKTRAFNQERLDEVFECLNDSPFVFLAGLSGVGKTTFVEKVLPNEHQKFHGESALREWVKAKPDNNYAILFLDEANITQRDWSEFEGLWNNPPTIIIDGELITLTKNHKIIFAGNPVSYSEDRHLPTFLERHGNSVWFDPLPPAYLYQEILKPIFEKSVFNTTESEIIAIPILKIAEFLTGCSQDEIMITPRELSMIAALTIRYIEAHYPQFTALPYDQWTAVAEHYAYVLTKSFVPEDKKSEFDNKFKPAVSLQSDFQFTEDPKFLWTPGNKPIASLVDDFLRLRDSGIAAGLGGITIEGEPGLGKSELVKKVLNAHHLTECDCNAKHFDSKKHFCRIEAGFSPEIQEALLKKAFHAGAVVVWDEINGSPSMERLLNELLMGKCDGKNAEKSGFMIIGTQNPATMTGRHATSPAILHRMHHCVLPQYTLAEMSEILWKKLRTPEVMTKKIIAEYQRKKQSQNLCFRSLTEKAQTVASIPCNVVQRKLEDVASVRDRSLLFEGNKRIGEQTVLQLLSQKDLQIVELEKCVHAANTLPLPGKVIAHPQFFVGELPQLALLENKLLSQNLLIQIAVSTKSVKVLENILTHRLCNVDVAHAVLKNKVAENINEMQLSGMLEIYKMQYKLLRDKTLLSLFRSNYKEYESKGSVFEKLKTVFDHAKEKSHSRTADALRALTTSPL